MAARRVGLRVIRRDVQSISPISRACRLRTVVWLSRSSSERWLRDWRRTSTLRARNEEATAIVVTRLASRISLVPRRAGRRRPRSLVNGGLLERDVEPRLEVLPGGDGERPADRPRALVPRGDLVGARRDAVDPEAPIPVGRRE